MESNNNTGFFESAKFLWKFFRKYWVGAIFILIFVLLTTYFQVISPKLMGNAVDEMVSFVGEKKIENIEADIDAGKGISDEDLDLIISNNNFDKETEDNLRDATPEELQTLYKDKDYLDQVYSYSSDSILNGDGLSDEQIEFIQNSDISAENKQKILQLNTFSPLTVESNFVIMNSALTDDEKDDLNLKENPNLTAEEMDGIYRSAQVRLATIELDEERITGDLGFSEEQIDNINKSSLTAEQKDDLINSTSADLIEVNKSKPIELNSDAQYDTFIKSIKLLLLSYLVLAISMYIYNTLMALIAADTTRDMREGLFGKLAQLSIRFFDQSNDGDLLSRFTNDIDNISNAMNQSLVQVISQITMLIGIIIIMFLEDESVIHVGGADGIVITNFITWMMIAFAVVAILLALIIIQRARFHISKQQVKLGNLNGYIDERISGQKVVISYGLEKETVDGFLEYNDSLKDTAIKGQVYSGVLMPLMQGIGLINLGILVFLGSNFVIQGTMTIGLLTAFIQYSQRFFNPLAQVVAQYNILELAAAGIRRVKDVFDVEEEIVNTEEAEVIDGINGEVSLEHVYFGYDPLKPVLKDVNINVKKGKMIALVGPTGSGKTTVMNLMNRFYDIDRGDIKFDGKSIKDITIESLRANVGIVLQESILFSGTVKENIAYGKPEATDEEIMSAAKTANIHEFVESLEDGYNTHVDNNTSIFSTGQKQLMSIARTIITNPDLLILDEATSNVDTVTEANIQKAMSNVLRGRTSFVIAHRLKTILNADEIIVLRDGEILEQGNHQELLTLNGFYAELYKNQFVIE